MHAFCTMPLFLRIVTLQFAHAKKINNITKGRGDIRLLRLDFIGSQSYFSAPNVSPDVSTDWGNSVIPNGDLYWD